MPEVGDPSPGCRGAARALGEVCCQTGPATGPPLQAERPVPLHTVCNTSCVTPEDPTTPPPIPSSHYIRFHKSQLPLPHGKRTSRLLVFLPIEGFFFKFASQKLVKMRDIAFSPSVSITVCFPPQAPHSHLAFATPPPTWLRLVIVRLHRR